MRDQGGLFLHELVHSPNLVGGGDRILDGNKCYDWYAYVVLFPALLEVEY